MDLQLFDTPTERTVLTVSALNRQVKSTLENHVGHVWLEGEISNLARPASGHLYFSLKDDQAQIRAAWFKFSQKNPLPLENGHHVLVHAKVSLYTPRGDYQLIVESVEAIGDGKLQQQFEALKKQLHTKGLFDQASKKPLPAHPKRVGIVTSATGAALRDVLSVLKRRCPALPIILYPCMVQGKTAAPDIVKALTLANTHAHCDVLLLVRGGGSLEDLWPFNEPEVAYAIYESKIPVVSGVGHEIDTTIADFVADVRAPTPSAAAELVSPVMASLLKTLSQLLTRANQAMQHQLKHLETRCHYLQKRLVSPQQMIYQWAQRLDYLENQLKRAQANYLSQRQAALKTLLKTLEAVSPLATLNRGYAIVKNKDNTIIRDPKQTQPGERLTLTLAKGAQTVIVDELDYTDSTPSS